jgi:CheY-like chemotaxis protein
VSKIVLCVDDSVTMQQVADITFRGTEFQYVGARSVDEALQKAKSQRPAVVLADAQMPGKTGYDLCMSLKSDAATADIPIVILVGNGAPFDSAKGTQVGADANLPKPWDTQTMLEKVTEIVAKGAVAKPGVAAAVSAPVAAASAPHAQPHAQPMAAAKPGAAAAAAAAAMKEPPRSATIMGMPTIKMPAGVAPTVGGPPVPVATKTTAMAVPPMAPEAAVTTPGHAGASTGGQNLRPPAKSMQTPAATPPVSAAPTTSPSNGGGMGSIAGMNRAPMVAGSPTKRSALVERTLAKMAARLAEAAGIEPGSPELIALLKLSTEVVERIVWEVVPDLAEQIIRENLSTLAKRS